MPDSVRLRRCRVALRFFASALLAASCNGFLAADTAVAGTDKQTTLSPPGAPTLAGDAARGARRSAELRCEACHGENGNSPSLTVPSLAGQKPVYVAEQLKLYRSGARANVEMQPIAALLSDADMLDLAAHYAVQTAQTGPLAATAQPDQPKIVTVPLAVAYTVFSTGDMNASLDLWVKHFGMEIVARHKGADRELARAWGLPADGIADQALLLTPGVSRGGVHLVRFKNPGPSVRDGAAPTALLPKNIDVAVDNMQVRYAELEAAGYTFRSKPHPMVPNVYEVQMTGPDDVNINLTGPGPGAGPGPANTRKRTLSTKGYGPGVMMVIVSADYKAEAQTLQRLLGMQQIGGLHLRGPDIEKIINLPPGAGLDTQILGDPANPFGTVQVVQYSGALSSENRYPRTQPPARGMLSLTYFVDDLSPWLAPAMRGEITDLGRGAGIYGPGRMATFTTPAGLRVDVVERANGK